MKIAFVIYNYSEAKGGVEHYAADLARVLVDRGDEVHVFCHNLLNGAGSDRLFFHLVPANSFYRPYKLIHFARNASEMLKQEKFDLIQGFGRTYSQAIYRVGSGCHWSYLEQTHPSMKNWLGRTAQRLNPRNRAVIALERKSFQPGNYRKIICISRVVKKDIQGHYDIPDEAIEVIHNTFDGNKFHPDNKEHYRARIREELNSPDDELVLLFVGSGFERKGLKYALDSLACLPKDLKVKLWVIGRGRINKYKHLAARQNVGGKVLFLGQCGQIERYYAAADIFLFPTLFEPFGTVCLEALGTGLPVIISRAAGASEILNHAVDSFVLEDPRDIQEMARRITGLADPTWRTNLGKVARATALKYSFEQHWPKVFKIYDEVLKTKS